MIDFLLGVPGKLTTIYTHLTTYLGSTRMAKVENLDAAITTRAAAATALSSAVWTSGHADKIANGGIPGTVKSIQTGYLSSAASTSTAEDAKYKDVTITAVSSTAKCVVLIQPSALLVDVSGTGYMIDGISTGRLTTTTNLRLSGSSYLTNITGRWTVIEYY